MVRTLLLLLILAGVSALRAEIAPAATVVVANSNAPAGVELAKTFMRYRGIPDQNLILPNAGGAPSARSLQSPRGVFADAAHVVIADTGNHVIRRVNPAGDVSTYAGTPTVKGLMDGARAQSVASALRSKGIKAVVIPSPALALSGETIVARSVTLRVAEPTARFS